MEKNRCLTSKSRDICQVLIPHCAYFTILTVLDCTHFDVGES